MAEKVRGVVDVVFLIDATGSMGGCIDAVKKNIDTFFDTMTSTEGNGSPVKDWRAKVVGYRDVDADGSDWLVNNPFTKDLGELRSQLSSISAQGGGDEPESLLDALYTLITMGETDPQETTFDPYKWRAKRAAARVIVIFTDASFKTTMSIPEARGLDIETVFNEIEGKRIILSIFAPDMSCYDTLSEAPRSEYTKASGGGLSSVTSDPGAFTKLMQQLAKSVSQSATTIL